MIVLILLIILGTIFQTPVMFKSGLTYDFGIGYWGPLARDGIWHEALSNMLKLSIPPQNPGFAGMTLSNYHFLYDLLIAWSSVLTKLPDKLFIYQIYPILFSIALGIGTFALSQKLFKNKFASLIAVFMAYFASSFGWIVSLIKHQPIAGESDFWANQPVSMNINPPYAISLVMVIGALLLLDSFLKKPKFIKGFFLIIISGLLIGFKAYAGVIFIGALFVLMVKKIYFDKSYILIPIFILTFAISLSIYLIEGKSSYKLINIEPFWLINTMIDAGDRVGITNFTARRFVYQATNKWPNLIVVEGISFLIFVIGNLGTRILAWWGYKKEFLKSDLHLMILIASIAAFIPPIIFTQAGNPWNIIQFFYYFLYFASLYTSFAVVTLYKKIPNKFFGIAFIGAFLLITPISSIPTFRGWLYPKPPAYLSQNEYQALSFLANEPEGTVLTHPYDQSLRGNYKDPYPLVVYAESSYVSAYSKHPTFLEDTEQQLILNVYYQKRLGDSNQFFATRNLDWSKNFLKTNSIKYLYLPKIYQLPDMEQNYPMKKIFENDSVNIYQVTL